MESPNNDRETSNHLKPSLLLSFDFLSILFRKARKPISKNIIAITRDMTKAIKRKFEI